MNKHSIFVIVIVLLVVGIGAIVIFESGRSVQRGGFTPIAPSSAINPKDFFSDESQGRDVAADLKAGIEDLSQLKGLTSSTEYTNRVASYVALFDAYSKDLRATINAAYNGYVTGLSHGGNAASLTASYNELIKFSATLTAKLRSFHDLLEAYKASPADPSKLDSIGESMKILFEDSTKQYPQIQNHASRVEIGGLDRIMDNVLGNSEHRREFWMYNADGSATIIMPIALSGDSRITNNIDKTPFMQRQRKIRIEVTGVDEAGLKAFKCHVKSDVRLAPDGDRQLDNSKNPGNGDDCEMERAVDADVAWYLAWRGDAMTKEEFARRYPNAAVRLSAYP